MMCDRMQSNIFLYYKTKTKTKPKKKYPPPQKKEDSVIALRGLLNQIFLIEVKNIAYILHKRTTYI